jgi:hypothetical protein
MGRISFELALATLILSCAPARVQTQGTSPTKVASPVLPRVEAPTTASNDEETRAPAIDVATQSSGQGLLAAMPPECSNRKACAPPESFARATCHGRYPSMALAMFEKHTPWQRLYLKAATLEAVNAYGDRSSTTPIVFGEEVLVLRSAPPLGAGKIQVSSTDIDVLRWDGTCATVARELFSTTPMPNMIQSVEWRLLEDSFQEVLLKSKYVALTYERQRAACKGSSEEKCRKATERLNEAIGVAIRGGIALPTPTKLPKWVPAEKRPDDKLAVANGAH